MYNGQKSESASKELTYAQICTRIQRFYSHLQSIENDMGHVSDDELREICGDLSFRDILFELTTSFEDLFEPIIFKE